MKKFAFIQMLFFLCSFFGLTCYFIHSTLGFFYNNKSKDPAPFPLEYRVGLQNCVEVFVLLGRWVNEIVYQKYGIVDIAHHTATLIGAYFAFYNEQCLPFAYILSQTNILHVPMFIWYFGCKDGCFLTSDSITKKACTLSFPHIWTATSAYRVLLTFFAVAKASYDGKYIAASVIGVIGLLLLYLDINWQKFFFKKLYNKSRVAKGVSDLNSTLQSYNAFYFTVFGFVSYYTTFHWN
jgi:hypothetical protein